MDFNTYFFYFQVINKLMWSIILGGKEHKNNKDTHS